jgi:hypothetical protein
MVLIGVLLLRDVPRAVVRDNDYLVQKNHAPSLDEAAARSGDSHFDLSDANNFASSANWGCGIAEN